MIQHRHGCLRVPVYQPVSSAVFALSACWQQPGRLPHPRAQVLALALGKLPRRRTLRLQSLPKTLPDKPSLHLSRNKNRCSRIRSKTFRKLPKDQLRLPMFRKRNPPKVGENIIEAVDFRGQHRVPQDTLRALIYTKKGDVYDEEAIHRDFIALWNTGRFDDLRIEKEKGPSGGIILRFLVTERRTVHTIDYTGNKSISKSEILDRLRIVRSHLSPESQFDPGKVQRAKNVLQEYLAERGHQYATVTPQIRQVPPGGVDITFAINEGPKVKVGHILIQGNQAFTSREVIRAMKNLKPIGIPHSLLFENLFARTYDSTKLDEDSERVRQFYQSHGYFEARVINHSEKIYDVVWKRN